MDIHILNTKSSRLQVRRTLHSLHRVPGLCAGLMILASLASSARAQTLWVRSGPVFHSNGQESKPKLAGVQVDDNSYTATDGEGKSNSITWSTPPATLTEGQEVVLTISSTTNPLPLIGGHWAPDEVGERSPTVADGAAGSWAGYKSTGPSFSSGKFVFNFKPGFTPAISLLAGKWDDYNGYSNVSVTWTYKIGTAPAAAPGNKLLLGLNINQQNSPAQLDYTADPLVVDVNVFAARSVSNIYTEPDAGKSSSVDFSFDGQSSGSGQTDAAGIIEFKLTLPENLPAGTSKHQFKVVATRPGFETANKTLDVEINRGLTPIVVEASASAAQYKAGDDVVITGLVYYKHFAVLSDPVRAAIHIVSGEDTELAATTTDDGGFFKVSIPVRETPQSSDKRYWKVNAVPLEPNVYAKGSKELVFGVSPGQSLQTTLFTDKAVYAPEDTIRVYGNVTSERNPVPGAVVSLRVQRSQTDRPLGLPTVTADSGGHFDSRFPVADLAPKTNFPVSLVDDGYYLILAKPDAKGFTQFVDSQAYVAVQQGKGQCALQEFEVGAVAGAPSTTHTPNLDPSMFSGPTALKQGARLTQGTVLTTKGNDKVALQLPFGDGAGIQVTLQGNTTLRIASFCKGANGHVRLRLIASNPAQFSLQTVNPGAVPLDYQIITPTAVITSVKTRYRITVDLQGVTTVVTEEGEVLVTPTNPALPPLSVPAVKQAQIGPTSVSPLKPVVAGSRNANGGGREPAERNFPSGELEGLSGTWVDDTGRGGIYRVRQVGNQVYWSLDAIERGSFANVYHGEISGDTIKGEWIDMPGSPNLGGGSLTLRIDSNNRLVKVSSSSSYGGSSWTRRGSQAKPAAASGPAGVGGAGGGPNGNGGGRGSVTTAGGGGNSGGRTTINNGAGGGNPNRNPAAGNSQNSAPEPQLSGLTGLSGLWVDDTGGGGVYRLRQVGNTLYWGIDATSKGSFANLYHGEISGNTIKGEWRDLPGSPSLGYGTLILHIESNDRLVKVSSSSFYGAKEWKRLGGSGGGSAASVDNTNPGATTGLAASVDSQGATVANADLERIRARFRALLPIKAQIRDVVTSDSQHADEAIRKESVAHQELEQIRVFRPRVEAYGNFCRRFPQSLTDSWLVSAHNAAVRIQSLTDQASQMGAGCDTADVAARVKAKLSEALHQQAEIVKLETLARNASTLADRGDKPVINLVNSTYSNLGGNVVEAQIAATDSEADYARAAEMSRRLVRDADKLQADLAALRQRYSRTSGGSLSKDVKDSFDSLEGQILLMQTPFRLGEYHQTARDKANGAAGYLNQASEIIKLFGDSCEGLAPRLSTALETLTNIETVTELTLDATARSSEECLKNAGGISDHRPPPGGNSAGTGQPGGGRPPKPPVVEEIPEDRSKVASGGNPGRGGNRSNPRPPVEQIPEGGRRALQPLGKCSPIIDLVGRESVPAEPYGGWTWNEGNITAPPGYGVQTFQWTQPAQRIGPEGFQMTLNLLSKSNPNSRANGGIHVAGDFILSPDPPGMEALSEDAQAVSKSMTVFVKPRPTANGDLYLRVGADYGPGYSYHYKVVDNGCPSSTRTNTGSAGGRNPSVAGKWILESVTVSPETPYSPWTYSAQSSSAHYGLYNGDQADFHWTVPPRQIDGNGFTMSVGITGTPAPNSRIATTIGVSESGFTSDIPRDQQGVSVLADGSSKSDQKSMTFKPAPSASELEIKVSFQWAISFTYKYRKAP